MNLLDRIPKLCAALRDAGLGVSVREEVAVRDVLLALAASGESPQTAGELRDALRPVLCRSQDAIRTYEDTFAVVFPQSVTPVGPGGGNRETGKPKSKASAKAKRRAGLVVFVVLSVLALSGVGYWGWSRSHPKPEASVADSPPPAPAPEPAPEIEVPLDPADASKNPAPEEAVATSPWPSWVPYALAGSGGLAALLTVAFLLSRKSRHRYLNRRLLNAVEDAKDDVIFQVPIRSPFPEGLVRACALELRKHRDIDLLGHLDVPATVRASVRRGGWFTPVGTRFKRTPEYLILIQQTSGADHRGRLARYLASQLRAEGVPVNVWTFRHEPDVLYPENDDGTADALSLEQLHVRMPDHRLLIFSGRSAGSSQLHLHLNLWEQGGAWFADDHADTASLPSNLLPAPAGAEGLAAYTAMLRGERALRGAVPRTLRGSREELPVLLTADRERWTDVRPPSPGTLAAGLQALEGYLGRGGMHWLRACAAYPELDWNLTVALGRELDERIQEPTRPDLLNRLIALPWFLEGAMPQWLRRALLRQLSGRQRQEIHHALNRILVEGAAEVTGDPAVRIEVHQLLAKNPSLVDRLARKLKRREPGAGWKERTVVETFGGEGAVRIPVPVPSAYPLIVPRWMSVAAAIGLGLLALAASSFPAYEMVATRAKVIRSVSNVKQILTVSNLYALDFDGEFPNDFITANKETGISTYGIYLSPLNPAHDSLRETDPTDPPDSFDYEYLYLNGTSSLPADTPLIRDRFSAGGKSVVGYVGGQVRVLPEAEVRALPVITGVINSDDDGGKSPARAVAPDQPKGVPNPKAYASRTAPFTNTLGMKFVPVPGTNALFCIWETRVQDYAAFAQENPKIDMSWKDVEYKENKQGPDHPVVNVSWEDAQAFCKWLSAKEGRPYRLPTDREWSVAVGLDMEPTGGTPEENDAKIPDIYPWGSGFPPPPGAGNYSGQESAFSLKIDGYTDKHPFTAPVGSYTANKYGLYDLGGNVWEWCEDYYDGKSGSRVVRGESWSDSGSATLRSSFRYNRTSAVRSPYVSFRCVVGVGSGER